MRDKKQIHGLLLAIVLVTVAAISNAPPSDDQLRAGALDSYLKTIRGPIVLSEIGRRSVVFINAVYHPETWVQYAREKDLPPQLMVELFDLQEGAPVPSGTTRAIVVPEKTFFDKDLVSEETLLVVTPIALNDHRDQAFFGAFCAQQEIVEIALVWMENQNGTWKVKKRVKVH